ncbi:MAG: hypothetical protein RLZZ245_898 [Verrucomicrobiota bacterium]
MTAVGNAAEGIPRGNIRGGRDPLAGGARTEMQHYTAHVTWTRRLAARVTARWDVWGCGATIFWGGGENLSDKTLDNLEPCSCSILILYFLISPIVNVLPYLFLNNLR